MHLLPGDFAAAVAATKPFPGSANLPPQLTTETLDNDGNVTATTDPLNQTTSATYDDFGNQISSTDANGRTTHTTYDLDGNVTSVTDPDNNTTPFVYDDFGNKTSMIDPLGHTASYAYTADGQLLSETDRDGRTNSFTYNDQGQVATETQSGGAVNDSLNFTYNNDGNLLTASKTIGASSYTYTDTYNLDGELATQTDPNGITLNYGYDSDGNVTSVTDSLGGTVSSNYNSDGMLLQRSLTTTAGTIGVTYGYNLDNEPTSLTRTSGASTAYGYDGEGRLTSLVHSGPSGTIESFGYSYDQDSRLTSQTDTTAAGTTTTPYNYDPTGQLTGDGSISHSYDPNGNRTDQGYQIGQGNQLTSDGTWNYTYDAEGNRISKANIANGDVWNYTYDNDNHLAAAIHKDVHGNTLETVDYLYDVFGNLLEEDVIVPGSGTTVSRHAYDSSGQLLADLNGSGNLVTRYLNGDAVDQVLARESASGSVAWYLTDDEGSVRDLVNNSGTIIDQIAYDAFGNKTSETSPSSGDRLGYSGAQFDAAIGVYDENERYYDPSTGSWTTQDPLGLAAGDPNIYRYVGNSATNEIDPGGQFGQPVDGGQIRTGIPGVGSSIPFRNTSEVVNPEGRNSAVPVPTTPSQKTGPGTPASERCATGDGLRDGEEQDSPCRIIGIGQWRRNRSRGFGWRRCRNRGRRNGPIRFIRLWAQDQRRGCRPPLWGH
jgi:RHS repeat-associated protein